MFTFGELNTFCDQYHCCSGAGGHWERQRPPELPESPRSPAEAGGCLSLSVPCPARAHGDRVSQVHERRWGRFLGWTCTSPLVMPSQSSRGPEGWDSVCPDTWGPTAEGEGETTGPRKRGQEAGKCNSG